VFSPRTPICTVLSSVHVHLRFNSPRLCSHVYLCCPFDRSVELLLLPSPHHLPLTHDYLLTQPVCCTECTPSSIIDPARYMNTTNPSTTILKTDSARVTDQTVSSIYYADQTTPQGMIVVMGHTGTLNLFYAPSVKAQQKRVPEPQKRRDVDMSANMTIQADYPTNRLSTSIRRRRRHH
jgi:hypothetical protein